MSEDFLTRWSRRKHAVQAAEQQAKQLAEQPAKDPAPPPADAPPSLASGPAAKSAPADAPDVAAASEPKFDPTTLPAIESITALTDVRDFLRAGVPLELTRAALRRAWSADPAIRDFVGLAENAWDFTDPHAMPGFGPLESTEEIRQLVEQVVGKIGKIAEAGQGHLEAAPTNSPENSTPDQLGMASAVSAAEPPPSAACSFPQAEPDASASPAHVALQQAVPASEPSAPPRPRSRGRALPQ